jgi:hypothetical protein
MSNRPKLNLAVAKETDKIGVSVFVNLGSSTNHTATCRESNLGKLGFIKALCGSVEANY